MKALTLQGKLEISFETVRDPAIVDSGDVIIKVDQCAICGSDLHIYHDREKGCDHGTIMGHEFVGEVVEVGSGVRKHGIGSKVISPFTTSCGKCYFCKRGLTSRCINGQLYGWKQNGTGLDGAQAQFVRVPMADPTLIGILDGITPEQALLLGDVFPTGYYCAKQAEISPGGVYAVLGCGPVGLMAVLAAKILGAEKLYALDSIEERLQRAVDFGAEPINILHQDPVETIFEHTQGFGVDGAMEVVGSPEAARLAYNLIRPGGIIASVGVHTSGQLAFSPVEAYDKNIVFKSGRCPVRHLVEGLQEMILTQGLRIESIITHRLNLAQGSAAYQIFDQKKDGCLKVVLTP